MTKCMLKRRGTSLEFIKRKTWGKLARMITNELIQLCNRLWNFLNDVKSKIMANFKSQYALNSVEICFKSDRSGKFC